MFTKFDVADTDCGVAALLKVDFDKQQQEMMVSEIKQLQVMTVSEIKQLILDRFVEQCLSRIGTPGIEIEQQLRKAIETVVSN